MASCQTNIDSYVSQEASLDVSSKYKQLMEDSLGEGSLYERTKDTYFELFKDLNISESEKIQLVATNIATLSNTLSAQAMSTAIAWAKEERDGQFQLAQLKAQTELVLAQKELTAEQICKTNLENELVTAQKDEVLAATIRQDELKDSQIEVNKAQTVSTLSESYRKSGVVAIGADVDGEIKGLSADDNGYTKTQEEFVKRQLLSFEDSKRNHAANSSAQMIGQLLSAEVPIVETDTAFVLWKAAMDYLTQDTQ